MIKELSSTLIGYCIGTALLVAAGAVSAAPIIIDFSDVTCGGAPCSDFQSIDQTSADIPGVLDLTYDADTSLPGLQPMVYRSGAHAGLSDVVLDIGGTPGAFSSVTLDGLGSSITLDAIVFGGSFDDLTQWTLFDDTNSPVATSFGNVFISGFVPSIFLPNVTSTLFTLQWTNAETVALGELKFTPETPAPVPAPAPILLLGSAIAALGIVRRRGNAKAR